jgi:hypothetical protein
MNDKENLRTYSLAHTQPLSLEISPQKLPPTHPPTNPYVWCTPFCDPLPPLHSPTYPPHTHPPTFTQPIPSFPKKANNNLKSTFLESMNSLNHLLEKKSEIFEPKTCLKQICSFLLKN